MGVVLLAGLRELAGRRLQARPHAFEVVPNLLIRRLPERTGEAGEEGRRKPDAHGSGAARRTLDTGRVAGHSRIVVRGPESMSNTPSVSNPPAAAHMPGQGLPPGGQSPDQADDRPRGRHHPGSSRPAERLPRNQCVAYPLMTNPDRRTITAPAETCRSSKLRTNPAGEQSTLSIGGHAVGSGPGSGRTCRDRGPRSPTLADRRTA